jgi:hypothetical protein
VALLRSTCPCRRTFVRQNDVNLDHHSDTQWDAARNQCSVTADDDDLTIAGERFSERLSHDHDLQRNAGTSPGVTRSMRFGHTPPVL